MAVILVSMMLYFPDQIFGTSIIIDTDEIIIKHITEKRRIAVSEINNVSIVSYERRRRRAHGAAHPDNRMRMIISIFTEMILYLRIKQRYTDLH